MTKTAAVIVTYNRLDLLKNCLDAIQNQSTSVQQIIIVDNNSTDGTKLYLKSLSKRYPTLITILLLEENLGGAGGFSYGIQHAVQSGDFEYLWVMDDDCIPERKAYEELLNSVAASKKHGILPGFVCSLVKHPEGRIAEMNSPIIPWDWHATLGVGMKNEIKATSCSFVSVLIPSFYVRKVGLPFAQYFIWFDDAEYTMRLSKLSSGIVALKSIVQHHTVKNIGVNFAMVDNLNLWKYMYGARNESSYLFHHDSKIRWLFFLIKVNRVMIRARQPFRFLLKINFSILKGLFFNPQIEFVQ